MLTYELLATVTIIKCNCLSKLSFGLDVKTGFMHATITLY